MANSMLQCSLGNLSGIPKNYMINSLPTKINVHAISQLSMNKKPGDSSPSPFLKVRSTTSSKHLVSQWRVHDVPGDGHLHVEKAVPDPSLETQALSLSQEFYNAINSKDKENLNQFLSEECTTPGIIYYFPYAGKEDVIDYLGKVMKAMGSNISIVTEKLEFVRRPSASVNPVVRVNWQLELTHEGKRYVLPTYVGCNEFSFENNDGEKLLISTIRGICVEDPVKLRESMLPISVNNLPKVLKSFDSMQAPNKELAKIQGTTFFIGQLLELLGNINDTNNLG
ncbi:hypothetical protein ACFE04_025765 [Oxalis oulophora]